MDVHHVNAYEDGADHVIVALRIGDEWRTFRFTVAEADHLSGMLHLLTQGKVATADTHYEWRCARCGSLRWVAASLHGPVEFGGWAIRQCVPCGHYSSDPVPRSTQSLPR